MSGDSILLNDTNIDAIALVTDSLGALLQPSR
jgi:hypothetical protein